MRFGGQHIQEFMKRLDFTLRHGCRGDRCLHFRNCCRLHSLRHTTNLQISPSVLKDLLKFLDLFDQLNLVPRESDKTFLGVTKRSILNSRCHLSSDRCPTVRYGLQLSPSFKSSSVIISAILLPEAVEPHPFLPFESEHLMRNTPFEMYNDSFPRAAASFGHPFLAGHGRRGMQSTIANYS